MHQNGKLYPIGQPLIPTRYTAFYSDGLFSPTGPLNSTGHRKLGERGVQSLCVFQCLIKTVRQANPGIVLTVGFVLESN